MMRFMWGKVRRRVFYNNLNESCLCEISTVLHSDFVPSFDTFSDLFGTQSGISAQALGCARPLAFSLCVVKVPIFAGRVRAALNAKAMETTLIFFMRTTIEYCVDYVNLND
jgi:hypothetical protein